MKNIILAVAGLAAVTLFAAPAQAQRMSCQQISNTYGTDHGVTWGSAPRNIRQLWKRQRCNTRPSNVAPALTCQEISDKYGTHHNVTWGRAPSNIRNQWMVNGCSTKPSGAADPLTCQEMSNKYGTHHNVTWGTLPRNLQDQWRNQSCNTAPERTVVSKPISQMTCQEMSDSFGTHHNRTWGDAPNQARNRWRHLGCTTAPASSGEVSRNDNQIYFRTVNDSTNSRLNNITVNGHPANICTSGGVCGEALADQLCRQAGFSRQVAIGAANRSWTVKGGSGEVVRNGKALLDVACAR